MCLRNNPRRPHLNILVTQCGSATAQISRGATFSLRWGGTPLCTTLHVIRFDTLFVVPTNVSIEIPHNTLLLQTLLVAHWCTMPLERNSSPRSMHNIKKFPISRHNDTFYNVPDSFLVECAMRICKRVREVHGSLSMIAYIHISESVDCLQRLACYDFTFRAIHVVVAILSCAEDCSCTILYHDDISVSVSLERPICIASHDS